MIYNKIYKCLHVMYLVNFTDMSTQSLHILFYILLSLFLRTFFLFLVLMKLYLYKIQRVHNDSLC